MKRNLLTILLTLVCLAGCSESNDAPSDSAAAREESSDKHLQWAQSPPLGWNSWDYYGTSITEEQAKAQADAMAEHLLPAGYDIFTVDIQWYRPSAKDHHYDPDAVHTMDEFGRLLPAPNRFPSAQGGEGFSELANYVHAKGLKFGIHIMRGIPKQAVRANTPVMGTDVSAQDIALQDSICPWNPDMFGVDARKPEGQAYYDSIIQMYADWGVDFIKVDDIARPYDDIQKAEIEAIRKAIDKTGRPIVLSLSPGATPVSAGAHVSQYANMWRITDDFWDRWSALEHMFERVHAWEPYRSPGAWPDADMLPLGLVEFGRETRFTELEQYTLMSLWSIARSPLIFGGDMTRMDALTKELLTNPEMLAVNQNSSNNRQLSRDDNLIIWAADIPGSQDKYLAFFNAQNIGDNLKLADAQHRSPVVVGAGSYHEFNIPIKGAKKIALFVEDGGEGEGWDHAAWAKPVLAGANGTLKLTELDWDYAETGWDKVKRDLTVDNYPIMIDGEDVGGIGAHAFSKIIFSLPDGYETLSVAGVATHGAPLVFSVLVANDDVEMPAASELSVEFSELGLSGKVKVRDLWSREDLGVFEGSFSKSIPMHGSGLYQLSALK